MIDKKELVRALRCSSSVGSPCREQDCPYWLKEETLHCDVDSIALDAAEIINGETNMREFSKAAFAHRIYNKLIEKEMTQKDLAQRTGVTEVTISRYMNCDRVPNSASMSKIATALGVTADWLMFGEQKKEKKHINTDKLLTWINAQIQADKVSEAFAAAKGDYEAALKHHHDIYSMERFMAVIKDPDLVDEE